MRIFWNRSERQWQGEEPNGYTRVLKRAFIVVNNLIIESGNRPECPTSGWLGYFDASIVEDSQNIQLNGTALRLIRFDGKNFVGDEHEVLKPGAFAALLLPNGICVSL